MARGGKKETSAAAAAADPEVEQRTKLKELGFAKRHLSQNPCKIGPATALGPSKTVIKHHGKDIIRKSQRKNKYLFSFPGLLGPISGGKIGELKDLGTKNPVLYLDFPQGQMKLFGTIIYPKNRYLTLQFSKGGKNVTCDDYFDNMIVFTDAWWIGRKDENPEELRLQFPEEMNLEKHTEYDFKGGIGVPCERKQDSGKISKKCLERDSLELDLEDEITESPLDLKEVEGATPLRHSSRTAAKAFKFAEGSSRDDLIGHGAETSEEEDEKVDTETRRKNAKSSTHVVRKVDEQDAAEEETASGKNKQTAKIKDASNTDKTSLVQTTLSTMFKKVEEKRTKIVDSVTARQKKSKSKASGVSSSRKRQADPESTSQSSDPIESSQNEVDDMEELSSTSQDMDASDEDWTASGSV